MVLNLVRALISPKQRTELRSERNGRNRLLFCAVRDPMFMLMVTGTVMLSLFSSTDSPSDGESPPVGWSA
jgi:hypothetical protein